MHRAQRSPPAPARIGALDGRAGPAIFVTLGAFLAWQPAATRMRIWGGPRQQPIACLEAFLLAKMNERKMEVREATLALGADGAPAEDVVEG